MSYSILASGQYQTLTDPPLPLTKDDLYRLELGAGRPLLVMHGGLGFDHTYLRPGLDPLAEHAHLAYYDHRGNGRSFYELSPTYDVRGDLNDLCVPTLVLSGRHDWIFPPRDGGDLFEEALPRVRHHVFEHSGHFSFLEEPRRFARIVRAWLRRLRREGKAS